MVTVHSLPNGQVNGHGHPRISPQWSGQWLLPSKIVFGISKILEYFWLFIKSFTPFTAIFSFICCKIIENSKPPLIFHSKFCPKQVYFLIWQWSLKIFSSMVNGHGWFSPQWLAQWSRPSRNFPQWSAQWSWPSRKFPQWSMVTTFRNKPYGKAWCFLIIWPKTDDLMLIWKFIELFNEHKNIHIWSNNAWENTSLRCLPLIKEGKNTNFVCIFTHLYLLISN